MKEFNVIVEDNGVFKPYDIMRRLVKEYHEIEKTEIHRRWKKLPYTYEEYKTFIKEIAQYFWWAKCEYEIILKDWPCGQKEEKWDVYQQVLMNLDIITDIFLENIGETKIY